jgi:hypothetical protein
MVALAALAGAGELLRLARDDRRDVAALVASAAELGVTDPVLAEFSQAVRRESDPFERRLALARMLFRRSSRYRGPAEVELRVARLDATARLAAESLEGLPASWEAANLLGAARFESRKLRHDTRLFSAAAEWELPLSAAVARASGSPMVERFLAAAYLEVWPAMSASRRRQATETLRRSFADKRFDLQYFDDWIRIAGSYDRAQEILPQDAATALRLADHAVRSGRETEAIRYQGLARERQLDDLSAKLDEALGALEPDRSRQLWQVIESSPLGLDFAPLVARALEESSPNATGLGFDVTAKRWLDWSEPLCLVTDCPLPAAALESLAAAGDSTGNSHAAFAALVAGDTARADRLARRADDPSSVEWLSFGLLDAQRRLANGDRVGALDRLRRLHRSARARPVYARLLRDTDGAARITAPSGDDLLARERWNEGEWRSLGPAAELEIGIARPAAAIRLQFQRRVPTSTLLQLELDGRLAPPVLVAKRDTFVVLPIALSPGLHLLRLNALKGALVPIVEAKLE